MAASDHLSKHLFDPYGDLRSIPAPFGTTPVPEGHVRVNHYTSPESMEGIRSRGISMDRARESFSRGGTEFPSIFANAGNPSEDLLRRAPVIEAHVPVSNLDTGSMFGRPTVEQQAEHARGLESRQSTVTTNVDVPKENIVAIHEPWHSTFRYLQNEPRTEARVMSGLYDDIDEDHNRAVNATKLALASKVLLGGKLGG